MSTRAFLEVLEGEFAKTKKTAEGAMAQVSDEQLHVKINPQQNSIAVIVQHMAGNMLSRWTDFLETDGEKATRDREAEFRDEGMSRTELMKLWEVGWNCLFNALASLTDADLGRVVYIRKEPHSVLMAINRQTAHYSWHAGQIALVAKHLKGEGWKYLTIAPGGTAAFNKAKGV